VKLWVDDLRPPPDTTWTWAMSSDEAILHLIMRTWRVMSLDHDLGGDDTSRAIVLYLCEHDGCWPDEVTVHSANPPGSRWLTEMVRRYKP
jgi:hypothetical protein